MSRRVLAAVLLLCAPATRAVHGQLRPVGGRAEVFAGSEIENYLRVLQIAGRVASYPWSLRAFSPGELDRMLPPDTTHPWLKRYDLARRGEPPFLEPVRPGLTVFGNTAFPYGSNDGAIWAGRGLTAAVEAGVALRRGPLSVTLAPIAFWAQNAAFRLMPNGEERRLVYADGVHPAAIDLPQRFGARPYAVLDPGQSTARLDAGGVAVGVSTGNQYWGPAREYPIMLGNNAAGFPHLFLGTSRPVDLWILRVHGRVVWGRLSQSDYSIETAGGGVRFGTGLVLVLTSRWVPGLEIGASRFAHLAWPGSSLSLRHFLIPVTSQRTEHLQETTRDNQLGSLFFRWVHPRSGVEVYAESGREDYWLDLRDLVLEPDHIGGYMVGFAKVLADGSSLRVLRAEVQNLQFSVLAQGRGWTPFYVHSSTVRQGHTQRGQILGSSAGFGGAGAIIALDTYHPGGRWTLSWSRVLRRQGGAFASDSVVDPRGLDVMHALSWNALFFRGRYDVTAGLTAVYELNRDFRGDAVNFNATLGLRAAWR